MAQINPKEDTAQGCSGKRALIYNNFLETRGGGERSSLDLAKALSCLGFEVDLACAKKNNVTVEELRESFGICADFPWSLLEFSSEDEIGAFLVDQDISIFVNHTLSSFMENRASLGIYMAMFPHESPPPGVNTLGSYQVISCNSHFTEMYVKRRWGSKLPTTVIPPPISEIHFNKETMDFGKKEKLILNVGRFNVYGHPKCQLEAINAFCEMVHRGILDDSWQLAVAGRINRSAENEAYFSKCQALAKQANVQIFPNLDLDSLCDLYRRASLLWQFTGIQHPFGQGPGECEHLGLVALDCFAYGVIPMVYQRGGMNYYIEHGNNGFLFGSTEELSDLMSLTADTFGKGLHRRLFDNSRKSADYFTFSRFKDRVEELIRGAPLV